ncbi:uncharacterized protein LOC120699488 isoform X2 [Panicum virgatum]|uniref:Uncharacterized protein n=1 Tax=Panicum virgatum TaxID=38727 RepID=A0A8T0VBY5_PANVG|nr:uncharacterized protein LOC120699488 isoform X2 [Panicum virgatum]KAG2629359.1 hypothetical protein PVAP13_3KG427200 [Panicum virgatum]
MEPIDVQLCAAASRSGRGTSPGLSRARPALARARHLGAAATLHPLRHGHQSVHGSGVAASPSSLGTSPGLSRARPALALARHPVAAVGRAPAADVPGSALVREISTGRHLVIIPMCAAAGLLRVDSKWMASYDVPWQQRTNESLLGLLFWMTLLMF